METLRPVLQRAWEDRPIVPEPNPLTPKMSARWWKAVQDRKTCEMRSLLDQGVPPNSISKGQKSALSYAVFHGEKSMVKLLLARGADPRIKCGTYGSPLAASLFHQDSSMVQYLLDRGAHPDDVCPSGRPVLHDALQARPDIASVLIKAGASLDWIDDIGHTPLMRAIAHSQINNALLLIKKEVSVNVCDKEGYTPLILAAGLPRNCDELINALLDAGADIDAAMLSGSTALMFAAVHDTSGARVRLLLERGANPVVSCEKGSVLHMAAQMGNTVAVELLSRYAVQVLDRETVHTPEPPATEIRRL